MNVTYKCYYKYADSTRWEPYGGRVNPVEFIDRSPADFKRVQLHKYGYMGKPVSDTMIVSIKREKHEETGQVIAIIEEV